MLSLSIGGLLSNLDMEFCYNDIHARDVIALECLSRAWVAITSKGGAWVT